METFILIKLLDVSRSSYHCHGTGFPIVWGMGHPPSHDFFWTPPLPHEGWCPPWGTPSPHLKMKLPHWKIKPPFKKCFVEKNSKIFWFSPLEHSKFWKKSKTVRKYYITWLIDLVNKFYDVEKFLDFIFYHVLLKIVLFY